MSLFNRVISNIENRKRRATEGRYNAIPPPFPKLAEYYNGIEKGKYEMVTANAKRGKTQYADFAYVYHPVRFCMDTDSDLDIHVEYLCLEMTAEQKMMQAMCHFLYTDSKGEIRLSPKELRSVNKVLDDDVFNAIVKYEPFFIKYLDRVNYVDNVRTIDEISVYVDNICKRTDPNSEKITEIILDHASLVIPRRGQQLKQAIDEVSAKLFVKARNNFRLNPILIQQQSNEKDSFEAKKMNDLLPSFNGLADSKDTQRDIDIAFGVFSPEMAKMTMYGGIQVSKYGDNLRILNIIGGRESAGQKELPLFFDGAVSQFYTLNKNE